MSSSREEDGDERAASERGERPPDIEFTASVKSRRLRFDEVPETSIEFTGESRQDSYSGTRRHNLPDEVEPGVVYRNSRVELEISTRLLDQEDTQDP